MDEENVYIGEAWWLLSNLQKMGGISALVNAIAYVIGIGMVFAYLAPIMDGDPEQHLNFIINNQTLMFIWHLDIYLVAGVFMVPLSLGLHERLKVKSPALMQIATAFGLIWTVTIISSGMLIINNLGLISGHYSHDPVQAMTIWSAMTAVEEGLGGAIELPGGLWILLVSLAAMKSRLLPRAMNVVGIVIGAAGIVTVIPSLYSLGYVFGIGAIVWFLWIGFVMIRGNSIREGQAI